jgi:hypothetical protein
MYRIDDFQGGITMSFPVAQITDVYIGEGWITNWYWQWGAQGWQGNTFLQAQPVGPVPTGIVQQSPGLVSTPGPVYLNLDGTYTFWVNVTNSTADQSGQFTLQVSTS